MIAKSLASKNGVVEDSDFASETGSLADVPSVSDTLSSREDFEKLKSSAVEVVVVLYKRCRRIGKRLVCKQILRLLLTPNVK